MPIEITVFIVTAIVANLFVIGALIAMPRGDRSGEVDDDAATTRSGRDRGDKYAVAHHDIPRSGEAQGSAYRAALRVVWWISIAAVLVGVGLSGAFPDNQPLIFAVGGAGVVAVVLLHEILPMRWRLPGIFWLEGGLAIVLITALVLLTGRSESPFVAAYPLAPVAVALARGPRAAFAFAAIASLSYAGILATDPVRDAFVGSDLLRFGANLGAIWLLTGLAAVYAAQERRVRTAFMQISLSDPLTGLFNRSQIFVTLDQEIRRTRRSERGFCILMIDLDGLKAVNDSFGHHRGDDVLRHLGTVIRRSIRTVDTAYRYGGDEFVVLLPETDIVGAFVVAEKIRAGTEEIGLALGIEGVDPSVSIGLVSHPEDGLSVEELMIAADRAMYQAKSLGKNQISGYPRPRRFTLTTTAPIPPATVVAAPAAAPVAEPVLAGAAPAAEPVAAAAPTGDAVTEAAGTADVDPVAVETDVADTPPVAGVPTAETPAPAPPPSSGPGLRPVEMEPASPNGRRASDGDGHGEDEPDPREVRRQIAAASRSFDPDHQIRRAMDAFLGPVPRDPEDRD